MALIIVHNKNKVISILDDNFKPLSNFGLGKSVPKTLQFIALQFDNQLVVWCHQFLLNYLNSEALNDIFHHNRVLASFNPTETDYFPKQLGYIERSFVLKINKTVTFPTWLMSSHVGGINTAVLILLNKQLNFNQNADYFLTSLAKLTTSEGLFCYSEPRLLKPGYKSLEIIKQASMFTLFMFVKQHYKWVWVFFLSFGLLIFEKKITLLPLIRSLFVKKLSTTFNLEVIPIQSTKIVITKHEIDVIIPTIGRKQYLYDVLRDLSAQTLLPKSVIIVEQNPLDGSVSELNYLNNQVWPFTIKHTFTHQSGVCNARNLALSQVESEWTFLGDDDNRFDSNLIETLFKRINQYGVQVGTTVYLQKHEAQTYLKTAQTSIFGAGNSIIKSSLIQKVKFNLNYEFNYGEDTDFGMQLRQLGEDVVYFADIKIDHLKAPIGGYRTKVTHPWSEDNIVPKPSPTIQLLYQTYFTSEQLLGYKLLLGLRSYKHSGIKQPWTYITQYKKQWNRSLFWSNKL
ncbi:glycosyltransferase family 2 protein [Algibacter lectus]|uniref:glycosyltransferase family 2 protein n=1 Tax=Algibacter lectus TaxID=221126 RepID=UPI0026EA5A1A|nr:glycosyltransferase family A protein [Algibacter lectus]MDO7135409.1 glycosyltransferase family A protein [Algibacter lectus]